MTPLSKKLALIGVAGVTLAGCTLPFGLGKQAGPQGKLDQVANAAKLSVMMETGQAGVCTITDTKNASAGTNEISVKGKKFRMKGQNFGAASDPTADKPATVSPTGAKIGYMLNDGEYMYVWEDQATTGFKVKVAPEVTPVSGETPSTVGDTQADPLDKFETDENYRIDCQLGNVDDKTFIPPTEVKFMEFGQAGAYPAGNPGYEVDPKTQKPVMPKISLPPGYSMDGADDNYGGE